MISIGDIIQITEKQYDLVPFPGDRSDEQSNLSGKSVTQVVWNGASKRLQEYFSSLTISDLCKMAQEMGIKRELDQRFTYCI